MICMLMRRARAWQRHDTRHAPLPCIPPLPPPHLPQILDGTPLRYGLPAMSVSEAKFEQKGEAFKARASNKKVRMGVRWCVLLRVLA